MSEDGGTVLPACLMSWLYVVAEAEVDQMWMGRSLHFL